MENEKGLRFSDVMHRAWVALKRNIVLFLAVIFVITAGGVVIGFARKPAYTAKECAFFRVKGSVADSQLDTALTSAYLDTIVDFCDEGCVVDRANYYYYCYVNGIGGPYVDVDAFIEKINNLSGTEDKLYYQADKRLENASYINAQSISVSASSATSQTISYRIIVKYQDKSQTAAKDKVKILRLAIEKEANLKDGEAIKYFGVNVSVADWGYLGSDADWSKTKIILISFVLSVIAAALAVYIVSVMDRTIRDKDELERIAGVPLLAYIEEREAE